MSKKDVKGYVDIGSIFLTSAFNNIEIVKEHHVKKKDMMAKTVLETAQKNIAYVINLYDRMLENIK